VNSTERQMVDILRREAQTYGCVAVKAEFEAEGTRIMSYWLASLHARGQYPQHETSLALLVKRETARLLKVSPARCRRSGEWGWPQPICANRAEPALRTHGPPRR